MHIHLLTHSSRDNAPLDFSTLQSKQQLQVKSKPPRIKSIFYNMKNGANYTTVRDFNY